MSDLLVVDDLHVRYAGSIPALRGIDLRVAAGEVVGVLGPNGAGKTTLLRAVTGLLRGRGGAVTAGRVSFDGRPSPHDPRRLVRAGMAQVLEGRRLFVDLTVEENLALGAASLTSARAGRERMEWALTRFPALADRRRTQAGLLSGGQQQLVAIARALMSSPRLLILDEPSLGLAPRAVDEVRELLAQLHTEHMSMLLVEQNARMALALADRGYLVERGRVTGSGTPEELLAAGVLRSLTVGHEPIRRPAPVGSGTGVAEKELPWLR